MLAACTSSRDEPARQPAPEGKPAPGAGAAKLPITVEGGLQVPESVLHDPAADIYLVSNIAGSPFGEDGRGFISRVTPGGEIEALKWIDGSAEGVTLNAPKGMAIAGDVLFVTDVTAVRKFDRVAGEPRGDIAVVGAAFLNDIAAAADGTLYVSDTGLGAGFSATGTDAIYSISPQGEVKALIRGEELGQPNGLIAAGDGVVAVSWASGELFRVGKDGARSAIAKLPAANLDGVVLDGDGRYLVSSWEGACIYQVSADGQAVKVALGNLKDPADIGFDAKRGRVLIPLFSEARVLIMAAP